MFWVDQVQRQKWKEIESTNNPYPAIRCKIYGLEIQRCLSVPFARSHDRIVPIEFARDLAYFDTLGSINCNAIKLEWRLKNFNGVSTYQMCSRMCKCLIYLNSVYQCDS